MNIDISCMLMYKPAMAAKYQHQKTSAVTNDLITTNLKNGF